MGATIIVTGAALAPPAMELAASRGARILTLKPYTPPAEIAALAAAERADAIIVRAAHVTDEVIGATPTLKVIVKHGIGVDTIDLASATRHGIPVLITHGANAQSVAEHAFGLMFAVTRRSAWLDQRMRAGHWDKATSFDFEGDNDFGFFDGLMGLPPIEGEGTKMRARPAAPSWNLRAAVFLRPNFGSKGADDLVWTAQATGSAERRAHEGAEQVRTRSPREDQETSKPLW